MDYDKYRKFELRNEQELKNACVDDFAYKLIKSFPIYENAFYSTVSFNIELTVDEKIELSLCEGSPLNNDIIGIFVPQGWRTLVWELSEKITFINPKLRVKQVKEKFGELRFYCDRVTKDSREFIEAYMLKSRKTCMLCGKESEYELLRKINGWIITRCNSCLNEHERNN